MPIFIKQIQRFANKHNLLCKEKLDFQTKAKWFANTKLYLRENAAVWTNICIVCYNCETHLPFYEETWLDFLTNACRLIFSQMCVGRFSHKCNWATSFSKNSRWRCRSIYASLPRPETPVYLFREYSRPTWVGNRWVLFLR